MRGTETENGEHSTPEDPRPRLRRRFFASLVLLGLMVGMMIGRVTQHSGDVHLLATEPVNAGLRFWFDGEPGLRELAVDGGFVLDIGATGQAANGYLDSPSGRVSWRLHATEQALQLRLTALYALQVDWAGEPDERGWRLEVQVRD
ncbi:hypothetical protein [Stutzerimonas kirkiae]|uniref:hypothetical protein n=1 Tax=Stutzerimonas kirkiae TaxID=2211392 RepID=UPI0010383DC2|nr:hypothetical protein [Stutzerimonas kirkiae]TBV06851.1 hypothetical protein DNK08_13860 [Stutzerimonas kirkiae]TBV09592.1 hypothetical protein DNK01_18620 [Stutzerimonas kirkiae]